MPSIPRIKVGDPITADLLNRIADRLEPWSKMTVAQGSHLNFMDGPFGKALVLMLLREIPARLIGTSSPYSWTALTEGPDGAYSDRTGGLLGGTGNAYELNGKANLDGKPVMLRWTAAGDWRFQHLAFGAPDFAWTFNVNGCAGTGLAGATIELKQAGVLIDSCVTADGTGGTTLGRCVLTVPAGTYDVTITGPSGAGFAASVTSQIISGAKTTTTALGADTGFGCWSCCNHPIPSELHSTDSDGPFTLSLSYNISGDPVYTFDSTTAVAETCDKSGLSGCFDCVSPSTSLKRYDVILLANCTADLRYWSCFTDCTNRPIGDQNVFSQNPGFNGFNRVNIAVNASNCNPMNLVFSVPTVLPGTASNGALPTPGGGGTLAFTA